METIEIKSMTSIEDAVKLVLHTAKLSGSRVVAEFKVSFSTQRIAMTRTLIYTGLTWDELTVT